MDNDPEVYRDEPRLCRRCRESAAKDREIRELKRKLAAKNRDKSPYEPRGLPGTVPIRTPYYAGRRHGR